MATRSIYASQTITLMSVYAPAETYQKLNIDLKLLKRGISWLKWHFLLKRVIEHITSLVGVSRSISYLILLQIFRRRFTVLIFKAA